MIETNRFIIRKFLRTDASMVFNNYAKDQDVTKYLTWYPHESINDTIKYLEFVLSTNQHNYAIVDRENNQVIGSISNVSESADFTLCEVGYCLGKKYWNQGIMTEVFTAYLDYLFYEMNYEIVTAKHHLDNYASGKVMLKCGFKFNGKSDDLTEKFGWISLSNYAITKEEYGMLKLTSKINKFFNTVIPSYMDIKKLINYLENNGYLIKTATFIENEFIKIKENQFVCIVTYKYENIINYYFIVKQANYKILNKYYDEFILNNNKLLIGQTDLPIELMLVKLLKKNHLTISFAESCTGGLMASKIVNISGASDVIKESYVTYSDEAKAKILGVKLETIDKYSVYSKEVAIEMAKGLKKISKANICASITGLAGSNIKSINDGTYDSTIIIDINNKITEITFRKQESGTRNSVRNKQANFVFYKIIKALEELL